MVDDDDASLKVAIKGDMGEHASSFSLHHLIMDCNFSILKPFNH